MAAPELQAAIRNWQLHDAGSLSERIETMIRPTLMGGHFGSSPTLIVSGSQYHLGGEQDTEELANLTSLATNDRVLDVACFIGGPAVQLAESFHCRVTGIDIAEGCIIAAKRITQLCDLGNFLDFCVADAANLPFADGQFTVVWSQCSLKHDGAWLREFDRVLASEGRLALTFAVRGNNPDEHSPKWTLQDTIRRVRGLGYAIEHAEDITERDVEIGWKTLDRKLSEEEAEFAAALGKGWTRAAHQEFAAEIQSMREGKWGNGRLVASKKRAD